MQFRHTVLASIDESEELLEGLMFGNWASGSRWRQRVDLRQIIDSLVFEQAGWSFAMNENNC